MLFSSVSFTSVSHPRETIILSMPDGNWPNDKHHQKPRLHTLYSVDIQAPAVSRQDGWWIPRPLVRSTQTRPGSWHFSTGAPILFHRLCPQPIHDWCQPRCAPSLQNHSSLAHEVLYCISYAKQGGFSLSTSPREIVVADQIGHQHYRHLTLALGSLPHDDLQARFQGCDGPPTMSPPPASLGSNHWTRMTIRGSGKAAASSQQVTGCGLASKVGKHASDGMGQTPNPCSRFRITAREQDQAMTTVNHILTFPLG
ncbi:hypothetical protein V8F33_001984 [Rhypophila sp. PSN 637]